MAGYRQCLHRMVEGRFLDGQLVLRCFVVLIQQFEILPWINMKIVAFKLSSCLVSCLSLSIPFPVGFTNMHSIMHQMVFNNQFSEWKKIMVIVFIREVILYSLQNSYENSSQIGVLTQANTTLVVITNPQSILLTKFFQPMPRQLLRKWNKILR
jgi:hypothetical protein